MPGQYSAVTLVGPQSTKKLALPGNIPVSELLAQLLRPGLLVPQDRHEVPASWMVTTADGRRLDGDASLSDMGIQDGEILYLHDAAEEVISIAVEDTRDAVEDRIDETGRIWKAGTGRTFATGLAAAVMSAAAFLGGSDLAVLLTGGLICLLAVVTVWWSASANPVLTHLALLGGALWAWRLTHLAMETVVPPGATAEPLRHLCGVGAAVVIAALALVGTDLALPYVTGFGGLALFGGASVWALALGASVPQAACGVMVVAIFALGILPRITLWGGGVFGLDRMVQDGQTATTDELHARMERVDAMLSGVLIALSSVLAGISVVLIIDDGLWERLLGTGCALVILTRSRILDQIRHVAPLRIMGALALCHAAWVWIEQYPPLRPWLPAVAVLAALSYVGMTTMDRSTVTSARSRQLVGYAEILLVAALLALAAKVAGLFGMVAGMSGAT